MLLKTKFDKPSYDNECVSRGRLTQRFVSRPQRKLILITAPPGFGKTTAVNQFIENEKPSFCWLSLDQNDDQPEQFWAYLIGALRLGLPNLPESLNTIQTSEPDSGNNLVTQLINYLVDELGNQDEPLYLILDDLHHIQSEQILSQLAYFIDYMPGQLQLILLSRSEPGLPLARWKVKNQIDHLQPYDIAFSEEESLQFLSQHLGQSVTDKQIRHLYEKSEGWIAALQLAVLNQASSPHGSLTLSGSDKNVADFIYSEVVPQLPSELYEFVLATACLKKLNFELCDSALDSNQSGKLLSDLVTCNLFTVALDNTHEWFRYQDIFREAILSRSLKQNRQHVEDIQKKAIDWYLDHNHVSDAVEQLIELGDSNRLITVLEAHGNSLIYEGFHENILSWLNKIPYPLVEANFRLLMLKIWALFFSNKIDIIPTFLTRLEDLLDKIVADSHDDASAALPLHNEISLIRSYIARMNNDLDSAGALTKDVLRNLDNSNMPVKSMTYYGIGLDCYAKGDLPSAREALQSAIEYGKLEHKISTVLPSSGLLAWILYHQGEAVVAKEICLSNQSWIDSQYHAPGQSRLISCWQNSALTEIHRDRNEISAAQSYIAPLLKHLKVGTEPGQHIIIQYVRAHLAFTTQDYKSAIDYLDDAMQVYELKKESVLFDPPCLSALKARCQIAVGNLEGAKHWYDSCSKLSQSATPLSQEQEALTMARVQLALDNPELALEIIEPLFADAEKGGHGRHLIEMLTIQSMALLAQKDEEGARDAINAAVSLAAKNHIIALFVEEGLNIIECVSLINTPNISDLYRDTLLSTLNITRKAEPRIVAQNKQMIEGLVEPISHRELEVLDLINQGLANKEIASRLGLAPATVKAHIRNIYGKIGAKSRTEALAKAREFNIFS